MNRKLSNLMPAAANMVSNLGNRAGTGYDQERDDFERAQKDAMIKCLSVDEAAPKEKHVRTLIMGTYKVRGPDVFWKNMENAVPLYSNPIVSWKFLIAFHRVLQDGDSTVVGKSMKHAAFIDEVSRTHAQTNSSYGQLVGKYGNTIVRKLQFHNKHKFVPGNYSMKSVEIEKIEAGDLFELGVDFLDQMESMHNMIKSIFDTFELGNKSISLTASGQCRLAAIAPCVNDTSRLLELTTNVMRYLHLGLPWDTLDGHRDRFRNIHSKLRRIYEQMTYIQYLRSLVQIPRLSEDISYFFETLSKMCDHGSLPMEDQQNDFAIQTFDPEQADELVSVSGESVDASMSYIQQEYSDLSSKYQMVLQMLESEQQQRIADRDNYLEKEENMKSELEALRKSYSELAVSNNELAGQSDTDSKLEKLKSAYHKLRSDHINLLRQKGDIEKKLIDASSSQEQTNAKLTAINDSLKSFFLSQDIQLAEANEASLKDAFQKMDEKVANLQMSLVAKEGIIRDMEQATGGSNELLNQHVEKIASMELQYKSKEDELEKLKTLWEQHLRIRLDKTNAFLEKEKNMEGGIPTKAEFFSGIDPKQSPPFTHPLSSRDQVVSSIMMTLMQFLPYTNIENVNMNSVYSAAFDVLGNTNEKDFNIEPFEKAVMEQYDVIHKTNFNPSEDVENEIQSMQKAIDEAALQMEKLMLAAKADESKKSIEVDIKILDECNSLLEAVQRLIREARDLQSEITAESGTFAKEFYQKNQKWSQGLISAAKDIGRGAKVLVDASDAVVSGNGKFEEIIAASQEISGSTAQMVLASKVKAKKGSQKLEVLSSTSKAVGEATSRVIATCRALSSHLTNQENQVDLMALSVHQTKRLEMEVQVKVLELENKLEKEREKLFAIRKHQYAKANNNKQDEDNKNNTVDNPDDD